MDQELRCPVCKRYYWNPVMLPCSHNVCMACATRLNSQTRLSSDDGSHSATDLDLSDVDKLSLISEADSGVVLNSRPASYISTPSLGNLNLSHLHGCNAGLNCPVCKKTVVLDERGVGSLVYNKSLDTIIEKYTESKDVKRNIKCERCELETAATKMCVQCKTFYCDVCLDFSHPSSGSFNDHTFVSSSEGKLLAISENKKKNEMCFEHPEEKLSLYCMACKESVCELCAKDIAHCFHDIQPLSSISKTNKQELSQHLHSLSERARTGTEFIQRIKTMADKVEENCTDFEARVVAQCEALISLLRARQSQLVQNARQEKARKQRVFREQVAQCTGALQRATGLLQFSIEVLKESDPGAFLQVSSGIRQRVIDQERKFAANLDHYQPRVTPEFEMNLNTEAVQRAVETLNFYQLKAPGPPQVLPAECSAENNTITIAWRAHPSGSVDGFVLELDDGAGGAFREVYCGTENICTVEGLHFDSVYKARVRAFNHAGDSPYSDCIAMQTSEIAWFALDRTTAHEEITVSDDGRSATCRSCDDRIILGNVGFSKGVHYWEVNIDRMSADCDPSFGIARSGLPNNQRLGKDNKSWAMYIDKKRSWFLHSGQHNDRTEGGIGKGSRVGVLLDLNQHTLSFHLDGRAHGPIAFTHLHQGVYYPAFSFNHNVQITLHAGLQVPPIDTDTSEDE